MKKFKFKINGSEFEVSVNEIEKNVAEIEVNGTPFTVEIEKQEKVSTINRKPAGKVAPIVSPKSTVMASAIKAPLPGSIMKVLVKAGQNVKRGDLLMTMESMKMENNILAENDGIIRNVHVQPGQTVMQDDVLIDFEGTEEAVVAAPAAPVAAKAEPAPAPATPAPAKSQGGTKAVKSPLPGSVLKVAVKAGQSVKRGDLLMTLESMKMENNILSERDAVVKTVHVQPGQTVMQDDVLFDME
ncbi:MAG: Pyruvate carboxylase [Bacteroidetes bacterium]|nr:Pyruvate carboxylase [Bacteroidota bacterium]